MNVWELIFMQSPANNGYYQEEGLPQQTWEWPKGTWFRDGWISFGNTSHP